jgi:chromate reductase, NAD(P)H dehydrogenase (quinone)
MKILSFGASTSSASINRQLAKYAAGKVAGAKVTELDLRSYNLPVYSSDEEEANGIPADAQRFLDTIRAHDAIVISLAEHNGSYSAAFKNLYDWTSRLEQKLWSDKPMLLLSTSPGPRGGASVMEAAKSTFPRMGAELKASLSVPSFYDNFSNGEITNQTLASELQSSINSL